MNNSRSTMTDNVERLAELLEKCPHLEPSQDSLGFYGHMEAIWRSVLVDAARWLDEQGVNVVQDGCCAKCSTSFGEYDVGHVVCTECLTSGLGREAQATGVHSEQPGVGTAAGLPSPLLAERQRCLEILRRQLRTIIHTARNAGPYPGADRVELEIHIAVDKLYTEIEGAPQAIVET